MMHTTVNGNLGADPESKALPDGTTVVRLRVASNDREKVNGEWQDVTTWVSCDVFGKRGETLARLLRKGSKVSVVGKLKVRLYDKKDGTQGVSVEMRSYEVELMGSKRDGGEDAPAPRAPSYDDGGNAEEIPF